jgi:cytidylate kinase
MRDRDQADSGRSVAPLREPAGSVHVDTSFMTEEETVNELASMIQRGDKIKDKERARRPVDK